MQKPTFQTFIESRSAGGSLWDNTPEKRYFRHWESEVDNYLKPGDPRLKAGMEQAVSSPLHQGRFLQFLRENGLLESVFQQAERDPGARAKVFAWLKTHDLIKI